MERMIPIPRQALAELLEAAGSPLTPEEYEISVIGGDVNVFEKYPGRAKSSRWSKSILLAAAVLSVFCVVFDVTLEGLLLLVLFTGFTVVEYRVHHAFSTLNPEAPVLGFYNQSAVAATILIYGLWHAFIGASIQVPEELQGFIDAGTMQKMAEVTRTGYLVIGIAGGISQFAFAWYYLKARVEPGEER